MNGIKMSDCKFYVDEAARTVVCVIPNTNDMLMDYVFGHFQFNDFETWDAVRWGNLHRSLVMPRSFMGKAVCSKDDEWNEETGRLIAYSRAKDKCYKSFFKRANALVQLMDRRLNDMITTFNDFGNQLDEKKLKLQTKIEELLK